MGDSGSRFPWWVVGGAVVMALAYLPTLGAPFDFVDDGDLVYPAPPGTTLDAHVELWWQRVTANVEHLGPFRPVLWAHWHVQANLFGADPSAWRVCRLVWCGLAAGMLLWLFRELRIPQTAALLAGAAAMWNPYRNEVWTSLTLSEGVAMPYALFALVAARKAVHSARPWRWDAAGFACVLIALGCKNTFAAIVPAQIALRLWHDELSFREGWLRAKWRVALLVLPLALPLGHFAYFQSNWHPGQYEVTEPRAAQFARYLACLKGAAGLDLLGAGIALAAGAVWWAKRKNSLSQQPAGPDPEAPPVVAGRGFSPGRVSFCGAGVSPALRDAGGTPAPQFRGRDSSPATLCALLLLGAGVMVYLPVGIISGRYAMPAVWGLDVLFALLLAALLKLPTGVPRITAWGAVCAGLAIVLLLNVHRQERTTSRSRMLWDVARHIETTAPQGAAIAWVSGDPVAGGLGAEEGVHMQWHLAHRGRADVRIGLFDADGNALLRAELSPLDGEPLFRIASVNAPDRRWEPERSFAAVYQFGRKRYDCHVARRLPPSRFAGSDEVARVFIEQVIPPAPQLPPGK